MKTLRDEGNENLKLHSEISSSRCNQNNYDSKIYKFKEKWGVDHPSKVKDILEKTKLRNIDKWGVDNYSKTDEYKKKVIFILSLVINDNNY